MTSNDVGPHKFGDIVYIEFFEDEHLVVLSHIGEDVTVASETGQVRTVNGSFVWSVEDEV